MASFSTYNKSFLDTELAAKITTAINNNVLTLNLLPLDPDVTTPISTTNVTLSGKLADVTYDDSTKELTVEYADGTPTATYTLKNFVSGTFSKVTGLGQEGKINLTIKDVATDTNIINSTIEDVVFTEDAQTLKNKTISTSDNIITEASASDFGVVKVDNTTITASDGVISAVIPEYEVKKLTTAETGYFASYQLEKDGVAVGDKINIPKDFLVKSGEVKTCTVDDEPVEGYKVGDKYIDFIINVKEGSATDEHIYLLVKELVDVYTAGSGLNLSAANEFSVDVDDSTIEVDSSNGVQVKDGGVTAAKLATNAVETAKIKDANVTLAKLATDAKEKMYTITEDSSTGVITFTSVA